MKDQALQLTRDSMLRARNYLEFGMGNTTVIASQCNLTSIISVESDRGVMSHTQAKIEENGYSGSIRLMHAELGIFENRIGAHPREIIPAWSAYFTEPWSIYAREHIAPELILINGRLRVACFLYSLIQASPGTRILWNDYPQNPVCHCVEEVLRPDGVVEDMVIFRTNDRLDKSKAVRLLFQNMHNEE